MIRLRRALTTVLAATLLAAGGVTVGSAAAPPAEASGLIRIGSGTSQYSKSDALYACRNAQWRVQAAGNRIVRPCYYHGQELYFGRWTWVYRYQYELRAV